MKVWVDNISYVSLDSLISFFDEISCYLFKNNGVFAQHWPSAQRTSGGQTRFAAKIQMHIEAQPSRGGGAIMHYLHIDRVNQPPLLIS